MHSLRIINYRIRASDRQFGLYVFHVFTNG